MTGSAGGGIGSVGGGSEEGEAGETFGWSGDWSSARGADSLGPSPRVSLISSPSDQRLCLPTPTAPRNVERGRFPVKDRDPVHRQA